MIEGHPDEILTVNERKRYGTSVTYAVKRFVVIHGKVGQAIGVSMAEPRYLIEEVKRLLRFDSLEVIVTLLEKEAP